MESRESGFGSIEPLWIEDNMMGRLKKLEKVCHHFHLSLQSGCDQTLERMNRRYTTKQFEERVKMLRDVYDDVMLTTDIIVGFPGETEEEFEKTYEFLKKIKFYKMHVFKYSVRSGTKAAQMDNQVENAVKEKRSKKLIELSEKNQKEYEEKYIGKPVEVLVEEFDGEYYKGHTANYLPVKLQSKEDVSGQNVVVKPEISTDCGLVCG